MSEETNGKPESIEQNPTAADNYSYKDGQLQVDGKPCPAVLITDDKRGTVFVLSATEIDGETGEVVDASLSSKPSLHAKQTAEVVPSSVLPEEVRKKASAMWQEATANASEQGAPPIAPEVIENFENGERSLKAPDPQQRRINSEFRNITRKFDYDAGLTKLTAEETFNVLYDAIENATTPEAKAAAEKRLVEYTTPNEEGVTQQHEIAEAAEQFGKPIGHYTRDAAEEKIAPDVAAGTQQEDSHIARLKAKIAAEEAEAKEDKGPSR
ncbi:MAG: hypothetical protein MK052_01035 [Alphaproteobacteria bacterium]|nr:hypothetical protein [Alphaproteobacteria bacterium]